MAEPSSSINFSRYGVLRSDGLRHVGFFLPDTFAMLPFVSALEPLRAANRLSGQSLYSWSFIGMGETVAYANNGMPVMLDASLTDQGPMDRLIVCGPNEPQDYTDTKALWLLRQWSARGTQLGSLDSGSYLLAKADLIKQRRCTIHWENLPGFREAFPGVNVTCELYEIDEQLFTCAGGAASMDMTLALIASDHGKALAGQVADIFISAGNRPPTAPQRRSIVERSGIYHPGLVTCIELMESNVEQPLGTVELARMINVSNRQLERLFRNYMQTTPTLYYQQLRLNAGYELLRQTTLSVLEIAAATGFSSSDYFSRRFRAQFGISPTAARKQIARAE